MYRVQAVVTAMLLGVAPVAAQSVGDPPPPPLPAPTDRAYPGTLKLEIDATDVRRAIIRGRLLLPVASPGPMHLYYPRWVPGHHAPSGPLARLAGLTVKAGGRAIPWSRDPVNMHAFRIDVPAGVSELEIGFDYLSSTDPSMGRVEISDQMIDLQWTALAPYPAGYYSRGITVEASVRILEGWQMATALPTRERVDGLIRFKPVPYDVLVDSPILAGRYFRTEVLDGGQRPVRLNIAADSPASLAASSDQIERHRTLIAQADRLFGARHFAHYDFLLGLTDRIGSLGAEHHQSSENFVPSYYFTDWALAAPNRELLPHEYVHSWNGKFRRGADLLTPTLDTPMRNSLLWVYEGLTRYLGAVLAARSGLHDRQEALDNFAVSAAAMAYRPGRRWRPLQDTVNHSIYGEGRQPWPSWQRGSDYYLEGQLLWLDVDTRIRGLSNGKRSLDDFVRAFFGVEDGRIAALPYRFEDVTETLGRVQPYDWAGFFRSHVGEVRANAPLSGLKRGGYRLVFREEPTAFFRALEAQRDVADFSYSIGLAVDPRGAVRDVLWDGPAYGAGLTIGSEIVAVDGQTYSQARLREQIKACKGRTLPLVLTVKRAGSVEVLSLSCTMGPRYPHLERDPSEPARLDMIIRPLR